MFNFNLIKIKMNQGLVKLLGCREVEAEKKMCKLNIFNLFFDQDGNYIHFDIT